MIVFKLSASLFIHCVFMHSFSHVFEIVYLFLSDVVHLWVVEDSLHGSPSKHVRFV